MDTLKIDSLRSLSQIFTVSNFRKIVTHDDSEYFDYGIKKHLSEYNFENYGDSIKFMYNKLSEEYCNEYIFKNTLLSQKLFKEYKQTGKAIMLDELQVGNSIADFVLLNGKIQIFEIKTDLDSFAKLNKQISDYNKFANEVYIVVSFNNADKILELYGDSNVGIISRNQKGKLITLKDPDKNSKFDYEILFKSLRKEEYLNIIKKFFGKKKHDNIKTYPNTLIFREALTLIKNIDIIRFQKLVMKEIKKRGIKNENILYGNAIPLELKHICYKSDFNEDEYLKLNNFLMTKI